MSKLHNALALMLGFKAAADMPRLAESNEELRMLLDVLACEVKWLTEWEKAMFWADVDRADVMLDFAMTYGGLLGQAHRLSDSYPTTELQNKALHVLASDLLPQLMKGEEGAAWVHCNEVLRSKINTEPWVKMREEWKAAHTPKPHYPQMEIQLPTVTLQFGLGQPVWYLLGNHVEAAKVVDARVHSTVSFVERRSSTQLLITVEREDGVQVASAQDYLFATAEEAQAAARKLTAVEATSNLLKATLKRT